MILFEETDTVCGNRNEILETNRRSVSLISQMEGLFLYVQQFQITYESISMTL